MYAKLCSPLFQTLGSRMLFGPEKQVNQRNFNIFKKITGLSGRPELVERG